MPGWTAEENASLDSARRYSSARRLPVAQNSKASKEVKKSIAQTPEEVFADLKPVIVEYLGVDEADVTREASMQEDLNADSLDLVELVMAGEEMFGVEIDDKEFEDVHNIGQYCDLIHQKRVEKGLVTQAQEG